MVAEPANERKCTAVSSSTTKTRHPFIPRVSNTRYVCFTSSVNRSLDRFTTASCYALLSPIHASVSGSYRRSVPKITPT